MFDKRSWRSYRNYNEDSKFRLNGKSYKNVRKGVYDGKEVWKKLGSAKTEFVEKYNRGVVFEKN